METGQLEGEKKSRKTCVAHRATLVQGDGREVEAFEQVVKGNTLARSIFKEYHLEKSSHRLTALNSVRYSDQILFWRVLLTLLGLIDLRFFSALST